MSDHDAPPSATLARRRFLQQAAAATAVAALPGCLTSEEARVLDCATAVGCAGSDLGSVKHIVMFMQENRSFDHYFGMFPGVRGFGDKSGLFQQPTPDNQPPYPLAGYVLPIHTPMSSGGGCTSDVDHTWTTQHLAWNNGQMNNWIDAHRVAGEANPWTTMAYYDQTDLAFYYALADAFTICDAYHCSVMGPTDPNHLYWLSAWLDPAGEAGGPLLATTSSSCLNGTGANPLKGAFTWRTMPQELQERGVSWKFYGTKNFAPYGFTEYFDKFVDSPSVTNPYYVQGVLPTFEDFLADAAAGTLPAVSWVLTNFDDSEHAPHSPQSGIEQVTKALAALTTIPERWASTVLFLTYDENGGFFDHVAPPTAPAGTPGEYITSKKPATNCLPLPSHGTGDQPIGLGFRVPMLVISPYSRGGHVCSDTFDHTSMLRFIESRFGAEGVRVPNLSTWRRGITGDLTSAMNLKGPPNISVPALPATNVVQCKTTPLAIPDPQVMPVPPT
jgi:phospholipase C